MGGFHLPCPSRILRAPNISGLCTTCPLELGLACLSSLETSVSLACSIGSSLASLLTPSSLSVLAEDFRFLSGVGAGTVMYLARPFLGLEGPLPPPTLVLDPAAFTVGVLHGVDYWCNYFTLLKTLLSLFADAVEAVADTSVAFQCGGLALICALLLSSYCP